jgi:hypothetical protein
MRSAQHGLMENPQGEMEMVFSPLLMIARYADPPSRDSSFPSVCSAQLGIETPHVFARPREC